MASLVEQCLGGRNVTLHRWQLGVFGMDRADVMMLAWQSEVSYGDVQDRSRIGRQPQRLSNARIVEGLLGHLGAHHRSFRRRRFVDRDVR